MAAKTKKKAAPKKAAAGKPALRKPPVDTVAVESLVDILETRGLTEIIYETDAFSIKISKGGTAVAAPVAAVAAPAPAASAGDAPASAPADAESHPGAVPSPMVGTAYLSPEPGAKPFISEGDSVREGQTLVIVEAMKVMNPIAAPKAGTVTKILVTDAQPIEYGQPLVIIE